MSSLYPVGCVLPYAGALTPTSEAALIAQGFLPCDGRALGNTDPQYQGLLKVIGTSYGGTKTTFCVPDYRGIFHRGTDDGNPGSTGGGVGGSTAPAFTVQS